MGLTTIGNIFKDWQRSVRNSETESPIEDFFKNHIHGMLAKDVKLIPQYETEAMGMRFRIDFVILSGEKKIAVECDGAEYHNPSRDLWRDAITLGEDKLDVVFRFRGTDLAARMYQCAYILFLNEKYLFSKEAAGTINITLSNHFLRQQLAMLKEDIVINGYNNEHTMYASRRTKHTTLAKEIYKYCKGLTAKSIEDLAQQVKKKYNLKSL